MNTIINTFLLSFQLDSFLFLISIYLDNHSIKDLIVLIQIKKKKISFFL